METEPYSAPDLRNITIIALTEKDMENKIDISIAMSQISQLGHYALTRLSTLNAALYNTMTEAGVEFSKVDTSRIVDVSDDVTKYIRDLQKIARTIRGATEEDTHIDSARVNVDGAEPTEVFKHKISSTKNSNPRELRILLDPHYHDSPRNPYFWAIMEYSKISKDWINSGLCGWSHTPEKAASDAFEAHYTNLD